MNKIKACEAIVKILRLVNIWGDPTIDKIYDLAYNYIRDNKLRIIK